MADFKQFEFFLLRYVPDAVKDEFVNIGVMMLEPGANGADFADVRFTRDWRRVRCLDPQADVEMLEALEREIRGQLRESHDRELLFKRIEDSFSNVIQLSSAKGCLAEDPAKEMAALASIYLEVVRPGEKREASGRQRILGQMRDAFEWAQVLKLLMSNIPVAPYTKPGDPLKFDFGYRLGDEIKLFHAVSLRASVDSALMLASRYPKIAEGIARVAGARSWLTAVVDDDLDRGKEEIQFALGAMKEGNIQVETAGLMPGVAEVVRKELKI